MNFFRREKQVTETVCRECGMEFSEPERMLRHMIKAHAKSGKGPKSNNAKYAVFRHLKPDRQFKSDPPTNIPLPWCHGMGK